MGTCTKRSDTTRPCGVTTAGRPGTRHTLEICPAWADQRRALVANTGGDLSLSTVVRMSTARIIDRRWLPSARMLSRRRRQQSGSGTLLPIPPAEKRRRKKTGVFVGPAPFVGLPPSLPRSRGVSVLGTRALLHLDAVSEEGWRNDVIALRRRYED